MNSLDIFRNKQIDGDENDLERCVLRADTEGYANEAYNAAIELARLQGIEYIAGILLYELSCDGDIQSAAQKLFNAINATGEK